MTVETDPGGPLVAVFAGPNGTVLNSAPLLTSDQARVRRGLEPRKGRLGRAGWFDSLRPQRLARPVTVYVDQHSAHPLEADAADLYGPPDGYLDGTGEFAETRRSKSDRPVYRIELRPDDGLLALPYMATRADGRPWDGDAVEPGASDERSRQPFYPDASRVFEEIDRFGIDEHGENNLLSRYAEFDFHRVLPPGGYRHGLPEAMRTDIGVGDIPPEVRNRDFFGYRPGNLRGDPERGALSVVTNSVARAAASGRYAGLLWLEGSPTIEETLYWLNLLVDTDRPIMGCASTEWPHGCIGAGGDRNLIQAMRYFGSRVWADESGRDRLGAVLIDAERVFTARDVQKLDARPGGYAATGGHGGVVASLGEPGEPVLTALPVWKHTRGSDVRLPLLPRAVVAVAGTIGDTRPHEVTVKDGAGAVTPEAIPHVSIVKHARFLTESAAGDPSTEVEIMARIRESLGNGRLAGFVAEANAPYGSTARSMDAALRVAALSGMPVVRVGRGNPEGWVPRERMRLSIAGANLTATKARLLLMACLMKFGSIPFAADPLHPTPEEVSHAEAAIAPYQEVFDTH